MNSLDHAKDTLIDLAIRFGPKLLVAILIMTVGVYAGRWAARSVERSLVRMELEPPVRQLLDRFVRVLVLGLFVILALQNLGIELLPLIAGLGVLGAGIALATQGVLSNAVAGLSIIFAKPYRVGHYVAIAGVEGRVEEITLFNTVLVHADRSRVVVPNRKIVGEILHNYGRIRQAELLVQVAYDSDLERILGEVRRLVQDNARVLRDPPAAIQVAALGDSTVQISIKPWVDVSDYGAVAGELYLAIAESMRQQGVAMPFPQLEVRLLGNH